MVTYQFEVVHYDTFVQVVNSYTAPSLLDPMLAVYSQSIDNMANRQLRHFCNAKICQMKIFTFSSTHCGFHGAAVASFGDENDILLTNHSKRPNNDGNDDDETLK